MKYLHGTIIDWGYHADSGQWEQTYPEITPFIIPLDFMIICVERLPRFNLWKAKKIKRDHPLFGEVFTIQEIK